MVCKTRVTVVSLDKVLVKVCIVGFIFAVLCAFCFVTVDMIVIEPSLPGEVSGSVLDLFAEIGIS